MSLSAQQVNSRIILTSPHIIAVNTGIDLNTTGIETSTWANGASLATHFPVMLITELVSGSIGTSTIRLLANGATLLTQVLSALTTVNYRIGYTINNNILVANTGDLAINRTAASGSACVANIYWFGVSL